MVRFVEIAYTGRVDGRVFDTTDPNVHADAQPVILPVEEGILVPGLARFLKDKEPGEYQITLQPEEAFGRKDPRLIQLIPRSEFQRAGLKPYVGLEIDADGLRGRVVSISGGRITVDFNHPLAGKTVEYHVRILRDVTDPVETVPALIRLLIRVPDDAYQVSVDGKTIRIKTSLPEAFHRTIKEVVEKYHPEYTVEVVSEKKETGKEEKENDKREEKVEGEKEEAGKDEAVQKE